MGISARIRVNCFETKHVYKKLIEDIQVLAMKKKIFSLERDKVFLLKHMQKGNKAKICSSINT